MTDVVHARPGACSRTFLADGADQLGNPLLNSDETIWTPAQIPKQRCLRIRVGVHLTPPLEIKFKSCHHTGRDRDQTALPKLAGADVEHGSATVEISELQADGFTNPHARC